MTRALLDSDVILDYVLGRANFFEDAEKIFDALADEKFEGYVSAIALLNVNYFAEKEVDRVFAKAEITTLLSVLTVSPIDQTILVHALNLAIDDYEDAVQCSSAIAVNLDVIVTRNTKDFRNSPLRVCSPAEFIQVLTKEVNG